MPRMTNASSPPRHSTRRRITLFIAAFFLLCLLLGLDLHFRGLVWHFAWSQTGEEGAPGQIAGLVELAGNLIRHPLETDSLAPIQHKADIPYGINTFLQHEVERPKIEAMLGMIRAAGFVWLRQEFPWEDLEVDGRGQYTDSRQDRDGDGKVDAVDAWAKYDQIVELVEANDLRLLVRLSNPPAWSRADPAAGEFAPPDELQDFVNYAVAVAQRYQGRIHHYQIWNEPNIFPEWGNKPIDPRAYSEMLCRTYHALKAVDEDIVVISAALAPTNQLDGYIGLSDLVFLQSLYDHGAGECFDVLSGQGYGLRSGPTDQRLRATSFNIARHSYYRDIMVRNGDAHKPIWLSEAAWNASLDAALPPDQITAYAAYGNVSQQQAADYMPLFYDRAQQEWQWLGPVMYWFFTRKDPFEADQAFYYFRMVEPDYQPDKPSFTPLPVYHSVKNYISEQEPMLYRGTYQAETWQIQSAGRLVADAGARFGQALQFEQGIAFRAHGTAVEITWRFPDEPANWRIKGIDLSAGLAVSQQVSFGEGPIIVDEITIYDRSKAQLLLWLALACAGVIVFCATLGLALRERRR